MVLINAKYFLETLLPALCIESATLQLVLNFLSAQNTERLNKRLFGSLGHGWVLLFYLFGVKNLSQTIRNDLERGFKSFDVSVRPPQFHIIEHAPVQILHCRKDQVVVETKQIERKKMSCFFRIACLAQLLTDTEDQNARVER